MASPNAGRKRTRHSKKLNEATRSPRQTERAATRGAERFSSLLIPSTHHVQGAKPKHPGSCTGMRKLYILSGPLNTFPTNQLAALFVTTATTTQSRTNGQTDGAPCIIFPRNTRATVVRTKERAMAAKVFKQGNFARNQARGRLIAHSASLHRTLLPARGCGCPLRSRDGTEPSRPQRLLHKRFMSQRPCAGSRCLDPVHADPGGVRLFLSLFASAVPLFPENCRCTCEKSVCLLRR